MSETSESPAHARMHHGDSSLRNLALLLPLTLAALLVMGYHPGLEDDSFYLAAIKRDLNPSLFPHDSEFFRLQFQATVFDKLIAASVRLAHLPLAWTILLWQLAAVFFVLGGCWRISRRCFSSSEAQWGATALVAVLLTLPLPGIAILMADQHLHPRTLATAVILAAIVAVIDRRPGLAGMFLVIAFAIHAIMAGFGVSFCIFLRWNLHARRTGRTSQVLVPALLLIPFGWLFEPASDAWRQAASTRGFYFLGQWQWYEWLGVFAPLLLLLVCKRFLQTRPDLATNSALLPLVSSLVGYGLFHTIAGILLMLPGSLERVRPLEPMRYLHLLYLMFFLVAGGLLGRFVLHRHWYRWAVLFVPLSVGMLYTQREMYPASRHLELPWVAQKNPWLQAFAWIRNNTPANALFALDPHYETLPAEDYHGFRALAERSVLADYEKDGGMAARVPLLAPRWLREVNATGGWKNFQAADLERLRGDFGVDWIVISSRDAFYFANDETIMTCPYNYNGLKVCRLR